ncbi:MAG: aspartate kinase [Bacteroidales bacterium]|nr:aspartate kinase [Bacteroidales bacterium]
MKIFKFGGGILQKADDVSKIPGILGMFPGEPLLVVISAFGKTTNAIEELIASKFDRDGVPGEILNRIIAYHREIFKDLFKEDNLETQNQLESLITDFKSAVSDSPTTNFAEYYDSVVGYGELLSSLAVHHAIRQAGMDSEWVDVRQVLKTDSTFRDARIDWEASRKNCDKIIKPLIDKKKRPVIVTQGFIASDQQEHPTSLGREGSDYTAAIFANLLDAGSVIIWKDVPGILNADPKHFPQAVKLDEISYAEATELAYYGAKVIHPKTIKPLQNKNIPLYVRPFLSPGEPGTMIHANVPAGQYIPSFIFKSNQALISISDRDLSFVNEQMFSDVFGMLTKFSIHMNLVQNSALTLTFCIDDHPNLNEMLTELHKRYSVRYNQALELITIRHFNEKAVEHVLRGREVLLEQQNRTVVQYVIR